MKTRRGKGGMAKASEDTSEPVISPKRQKKGSPSKPSPEPEKTWSLRGRNAAKAPSTGNKGRKRQTQQHQEDSASSESEDVALKKPKQSDPDDNKVDELQAVAKVEEKDTQATAVATAVAEPQVNKVSGKKGPVKQKSKQVKEVDKAEPTCDIKGTIDEPKQEEPTPVPEKTQPKQADTALTSASQTAKVETEIPNENCDSKLSHSLPSSVAGNAATGAANNDCNGPDAAPINIIVGGSSSEEDSEDGSDDGEEGDTDSDDSDDSDNSDDSDDSDDSDVEEISSDSNDGTNMENLPGATAALANPQQNTAVLSMEARIRELESMLANSSKHHNKMLEKKEVEIQRLKNQVQWKEEQLQDMNVLAHQNVELESKVNVMLSGKKGYEKEVKIAETSAQKEQESADTKEGVAAATNEVKQIKQKSKDEDTVGEDADSEDQSDEDDAGTGGKRGKKEAGAGGKKKRRSTRSKGGKKKKKKKKKEEEDEGPDEIDAYFVDNDSDVEVVGEEKAPVKVVKAPEVEAETVVVGDEEEQGENEDDDDESSPLKGRKSIRKMIAGKKLSEETKQAAKAEKERRDRVKKEHEKHRVVTETDPKTKLPVTKQLVLAFKADGKTPLVELNSKMVRKLKPHQVEAIEFMWDTTVESVERIRDKDDEGSGCILAHCMGLGKTLSVIGLVHTLLTSKACARMKKCLVVCPLNTVLNWQYEWEKWLDKKDRLPVHELSCCKGNHDRMEKMQEWKKSGGILIIGYALFRILATYSGRSKKTKKIFEECLINPGPDLVVCDEGHILKNDTSAISKCMNSIRTKRRIVLTGTPLQNNLIEYHCMVNFVKPNLLGTRREFANRFVNPITNGQHSDSTAYDVKIMKRRAHVLHEMLAGCVQRRDYTALSKFLPPKHEYVVSVRLSPLQIELYRRYMELHRPEAANLTSIVPGQPQFKLKGAGLFADYQNLMRIWTHPWVMKMDEIRQEKKPYTEEDDDELGSVLFTSSSEDEAEDEEQIEISDSDSAEATSETTEEEAAAAAADGAKGKQNNGDKEPVPVPKPETVDKEQGPAAKGKKAKHVYPVARTRGLRSRRGKPNESSEDEEEQIEEEEKEEKKEEEKPRTRSLRSTAKSGQTAGAEDKKTVNGDNDVEKDTKPKSKDDSKGKAQGKKKKEQHEAVVEPDVAIVETEDAAPGTRKAKLVAGEVIKQWRSQSRGGQGKDEEIERKKDVLWWHQYVTDEDKFKMELSGKMMVLFQIIRMAETIGDKVLVFSQSLLSLDLLEDFLKYQTEESEKVTEDKVTDDKVTDDKDTGDKVTNDKDTGDKVTGDKDTSAKVAGAKVTGDKDTGDKDTGDKVTGDKDTDEKDKLKEPLGPIWKKDEDYFRMDGSTQAHNRKKFTTLFNDPKNKRCRLFLISTRAGGLGINLEAANRVIIFDASWNPSHDIQSIFRVYRFGQAKDVFVYRLLAQGTMEEKIYERQVTKETLSQRVIDEHQIDRHFTAEALQELYIFKPDIMDDPDAPPKPIPVVPKDLILAELMTIQKEWISQYHEHDSLLENRPDEDLSEEERKAAWDEYERDKQGLGGLYRSTSSYAVSSMIGTQMANSMPGPGGQFYRHPAMASVTGSSTVGQMLGLPRVPNNVAQPKYNVQVTQLPRVVQEILKYNPNITTEELSRRLQAFLGMHNRYGSVPGHAMGGMQSFSLNLPGLMGLPGPPPPAGAQGAPPPAQAEGQDNQGTAGEAPPLAAGQAPGQAPALQGGPPAYISPNAPAINMAMPSRLPQPGIVPAMKK